MDIYNKLGFIEKRLRKKMGLSLENVSKDLKVSKGNLCEMENGKRPLKEETFHDFIECYQRDFRLDPFLIGKAEDLLDNLINAYVYKNEEKENELIQTFYEWRTRLELSSGCLHIPLIECFLTHPLKGTDFSSAQQDIFLEVMEYFPVYEPDEKALYFYIKAFTAKKRDKYEEADKNYRLALQELSGKKWPQLEGIIKQNYSVTLLANASFYSAYVMAKEAHEFFAAFNNYKRALMCANNLANCLVFLQSFTEAKKYLNQILLTVESFSGSFIHKYIVSTMVFILVLEEEYEKAIWFSKEHPIENDGFFVGNLSLIPYCYFRIGLLDQCQLEMDRLTQKDLAADEKALFNLLKSVLRKDLSEIEAARKRMIQVCCRQLNWGMLMVMYQLLIYFYKSENQTALVIEAYEEKDKVYQHQLPAAYYQETCKRK